MRINGYRCDACCKEHLLEPYREFNHYSEHLPAEWYIVSRGNVYETEELPWTFCSVQCLHDWTAKKLPLPPKEVARIANEVQEETTHWENWR